MLFSHSLHMLPFALLGVANVVAAQSYEYIVVGSGPGGGPLAANLARAGHTVLLLEAGDDQGNNPNVSIVANAALASNDPATRWDFFVKHSGDPERELKYNHMVWRKPDGSFYVGLDPPAGSEQLGVWYPRAGTVGGCATHNVAAAFLPADADWNRIASLTGDDSWTPANMRQHLVALERNLYLPNGTAGHGFNGYLNINQDDNSWTYGDSDGKRIVEHAAIATGYNASDLPALLSRDINADDPNRDHSLGIFPFSNHQNNEGIRSSPVNYIRDTVAAGYPLTLQQHSLVTKVLFDNSTNSSKPTAVGVEFLQGQSMYSADPRYDASDPGVKGTAYATREVIISGGTFNSPQILKLSGIGPAKELASFGIPVVKDLPGVGINLSDNYEASILSLASRPLNGTSGRVPILWQSSLAENGIRDIFFWCAQFAFEGFWPGWPDDFGPAEYECALAHMNPRSQAGTVLLKSANPRDTPDINLNFFAENENLDLGAMSEAISWARANLFDSAPEDLKPWNELHPCPSNSSSSCSEAEQREYIKLQAYSHHATSTCAIGSDTDPNAVLDSRFRVRGVNGLRVVDASAFPRVPGAFPVLPVFVLGQKASAVLLEDAANTVYTTTTSASTADRKRDTTGKNAVGGRILY